MSYSIFTIPSFDKQLKRLVKKYPSLKTDFLQLVLNLEINPKQGVSLGNNCFKLRLNITSKAKGKSGGARVITYLLVNEEEIYLLSIYDKSEKETISNKELQELLQKVIK